VYSSLNSSDASMFIKREQSKWQCQTVRFKGASPLLARPFLLLPDVRQLCLQSDACSLLSDSTYWQGAGWILVF